MASKTISMTYNVDNHNMIVVAEADIHYKLQSDDRFAIDYFNKIIRNQQMTEEYNGEVDPENNDLSQQPTETQPSTSSQSNESLRWQDEHIKLLLDEYLKRLDQFRSEGRKKIQIWQEISDEFQKKNIIFTRDELDSKMRNIKNRYKEILRKNDSRRTTGAGRSNWPWMSLMADIFKNDDSVHFNNVEATETINLQPPKPIERNNSNNKKLRASESSSDSSDSDIEEDGTKKRKKRRTYSHQLKKKNKIESKKIKILSSISDGLKETNQIIKQENNEKNQVMWELLDALKMRTAAINADTNAVQHH